MAQLVHTVADVQTSHAVPHAVHAPVLKKYPDEHVVHTVSLAQAAQFKGQQIPLTST